MSLLAFGGWAIIISQPALRAGLGAQSPLWWAEQLLIVAQALLCLGIGLRYHLFVRPALFLTMLRIGVGALHWFQTLAPGHVSLPVGLLLNILLAWRLLATRRATVIAPAS